MWRFISYVGYILHPGEPQKIRLPLKCPLTLAGPAIPREYFLENLDDISHEGTVYKELLRPLLFHPEFVEWKEQKYNSSKFEDPERELRFKLRRGVLEQLTAKMVGNLPEAGSCGCPGRLNSRATLGQVSPKNPVPESCFCG